MRCPLLAYFLLVSCLFSSCSSCGEYSTATSNHTDNTIENDSPKSLYNTPQERLQANINQMIDEQVEVSNTIYSKRVQALIAGFELGMSRNEVKKHFLNMKQKKHLVRVLKRNKGSKKTYEYVYPLPIKSGRAYTSFNFKHQDGKEGVYKLVCKPRKPRRLNKAAFLEEIHNLFSEWYGLHSFQLPNQHNCARYIWIAGNRHLDLHSTPREVTFIYTDLKAEIPPNIDGGGKHRPASEALLQ